MEDNILSAEYTINGDKYVVTATKVENNDSNNTLIEDEGPNYDEYFNLCDDYDVEPLVYPHKPCVMVSVNDIPEGITLELWTALVLERGIILTK